jgi:hypothetical protein
MYHQKCAEQVFYAKDGDAINSPVNCKTFLLITQLVCQFGVPQKHVSKVIVTVMQSAGVEPRNFPDSAYVKSLFRSGKFKNFTILCNLTYIDKFCDFDLLSTGGDESSMKGLMVYSQALFAKSKKSSKILKVPFMLFEVAGKAPDLVFQNFERELQLVERLYTLKYKQPISILSRITSSVGDSDNSQGAFMKNLEKIGLQERKKTNLLPILSWVHGTCSQHNTSSKMFFFSVKSSQSIFLQFFLIL